MIKKILMFLIVFCGLSFAYLPVSISPTTYSSNANFSVDASASSITENLNISAWCEYPFATNASLTVYNVSATYFGVVNLNESGTWNCYFKAYNSTDVEYNSTSFTVNCPTAQPISYLGVCYQIITITLGNNQSYYDVGDNITLWTTIINTTSTSSVYIYSADNSTTSCLYSLIRTSWYCYYKIRQSQEVLVVQSFNDTGGVTGIGEYTLTINPLTVTSSSWESLWQQMVNYIIIGVLIIVGVLFMVTLGPTIVFMLLQGAKEK